MSYILDAIKKAEKQRQAGQVPTLESSVAFQAGRSWRFPWTRFLTLLIIIAIIAALAWNHGLVTAMVVDTGKQAYSWMTGLLPSRQSLQSPGTGQVQGEPVVQEEVQQKQVPVDIEPEPESDPADTHTISDADRQRLGQVRLSVISYSSDANKRFIMEGSNLLREGDQLHGYPILEIRKNSILVDVRGTPWEIRLK
jgi:hypothetical protein